ncbi:MAG: hypothetical protein JWN92_2771 [Candidatus Acidoferrum typicum]|nr:hypothetical protein [Candidatus Acidoferrum typicum]
MSYNPTLHMLLVAPDAKTILDRLPFESQKSTAIERLFGDNDTPLMIKSALVNAGI